MAQENTAINQLIHLVTAPKVVQSEERESVEDLFWARNRVNARGARATAIGTPVPMPANPHGMFSSDMDGALQMSGVYSSAVRPDVAQAQALAVAASPAANMNREPFAAGSSMSPMPGSPPSNAAAMAMLPMGLLESEASTISPTLADTPGARHAARVAAARAAVSSGSPAGHTAAARAAAAREMAANALAAQGAAIDSTTRGVPSAAARAIAQQAAAATMRGMQPAPPATASAHAAGVRPIFHDDEDDEQTMRVDRFQERFAQVHGHIAYAQALPEPTMRVVPLTTMDAMGARRAVVVELLQTMRRFVVPFAILMVVAVFAGGYVAFDGQGGKPRRASVSVSGSASADSTGDKSSGALNGPRIEAIADEQSEPELSVSAILATKMAQARIEESIALARGAVVVEEDEIEMDAVKVGSARSRAATAKSRARDKRAKREARARADRDALDEALDSAPEKRDGKRESRRSDALDAKRGDKKRDNRRDEAVGDELPANVANRTAATSGKLAVTSNVPAMIYVDGRATGMMTPKKLAVPAGPHKITLLEPTSKKAKTQDVEIVAGKTASIDKEF